jgi:hypothetical protein
MADIDIVPKRRTNTWIWVVLAAVVVLALLWLILGGGGTTTTGMPQGWLGPASTATASLAVPPGLRA